MEIVKNVRSYGAAGNGSDVDTAAIQQAIDVCHTQGGGQVLVPAGTYLAGTIQLRSRVTLNLAPGSVLCAASDPAAYSHDVAAMDYSEDILQRGMFSPLCFIYADDAQDVGIVGTGTIDGAWTGPGDARARRRPLLIRFLNCRNVLVRDVTMARPPAFTTYWEHCTGVRIEGVTIMSRTTPNGDGLDFNGCEDVLISRCNLDCGDDAISLKPMQRSRPSRRFIISDCTISSAWAAIRLGPESYGGMQDIVVTNCIFHDCRDGLKIQNAEGAVMEDMLFSNIVIRDVNRPFFFTLNRFGFSRYLDEDFECGILRDIRCVNIRAISREPASDDLFDMPCAAIVGLPGYPIEGISFSDVHITMPGGGSREEAQRTDIPELTDSTELWPEAKHFGGPLPCSALYLRHAHRVSLRNVRLSLEKADLRPFIGGNDVHGISLDTVTVDAPAPLADLCSLRGSSRISIRNSE